MEINNTENEIRVKLRSVRYEVEASLFGLDDEGFSEISVGECPEPEVMEINMVARKRTADGRFEVFYEETEVTGMAGSTTSISFSLDEKEIVSMVREGSVSTALVFEQGQRHHCVYNTPYMPFEICVHTMKVENLLLEAGTLELDYVIEIRGAKAERTKFSMQIL